MDNPNTNRPEFGVPFRNEVEIRDFEKIEKAREELYVARKLIDSPQDKPIAANLLEGLVLHVETPNEVKMEAFHEAIQMLTKKAEHSENLAIAKSLIDMIRAQSDRGLKLRLAGILAHDLHDEYWVNNVNEGGQLTVDDLETFQARQFTFFSIMRDGDEAIRYKQWAKRVLNPPEIIRLYSQIYENDLDKMREDPSFQPLEVIPRNIIEITEEGEGAEIPGNEFPAELIHPGILERLPPPKLPTMEKIDQYFQMTKRHLPIYIVRREGAKLISIEFPADLSAEAAALATKFRNGEIERDDVFNNAWNEIFTKYLSRMNPNQREELMNLMRVSNLEIRFSTERGMNPSPVDVIAQAA